MSKKTNGYMLWLQDNREEIKKMYFSNYEVKVIDGKKENLSTLLTKKAGEIWKSLDTSVKDIYSAKSRN